MQSRTAPLPAVSLHDPFHRGQGMMTLRPSPAFQFHVVYNETDYETDRGITYEGVLETTSRVCATTLTTMECVDHGTDRILRVKRVDDVRIPLRPPQEWWDRFFELWMGTKKQPGEAPRRALLGYVRDYLALHGVSKI